MPDIVDIETGEVVTVSRPRATEAIRSGLYRPADSAQTVDVVDSTGMGTVSVSADQLQALGDRGDRIESSEEFRGREDGVRKEREHGGLLGTAATVVEAGAGSASFGLTDYIAGAIGGEEYRTERRERREVNSTAALVGDVGGMILPALATGGSSAAAKLAASTPAGLAAKLGARNTIKAMALEGAVSGVGQAAHELAVSENPYDLELAASTFQSGAVMGGLLGGGIGIFAKAAGKGLQKAQKALAEAGEGAAKTAKTAKNSDDLALMDAGQLKKAKVAQELEHGHVIVHDAKAYHKLSQQVDPMLVASAEQKAVLRRVKSKRARMLSNEKKLAGRSSPMLEQMQLEEQAIAEMIRDGDSLLSTLAREDEIYSSKLAKMALGKSETAVIKNKLARKYSDWAGKRFTGDVIKEGVEVSSADLAKFKAALDSGGVGGARKRTVDGLEELLESNLIQQAKMESLLNGTTDEILAIEAASEALKAGKKETGGLASDLLAGSTFTAVTALASPLGIAAPVLGAKAAKVVRNLTLGRLAKAAAEASSRTARAVEKLLSNGTKAGQLVAPVATRSLVMASYAPPTKLAKAKARFVGEKTGLIDSFRARSSEILSQVERGPDGIRMTRRARTELATRLAPVRATSPAMADAIESLQARKISYLASKLPKRPDYILSLGAGSEWTPSTTEIRDFARHMAAVEDPGAVEERLADGTLSPEDAEAYRSVYPEKYAALQRDITSRLGELRETLSYRKRLSLSIFSAVAIEPAMDPRVFLSLQSQYSEEHGTEGGSHAPVPKPQFGSVKSQEPATPSQQRQA